MPSELIQLKDISIAFADRQVISHLNLPIYKGETLAIVGESGSGKSLTALSILRLLPKNAKIDGHIFLNNVETVIHPTEKGQAILDKVNLLDLPITQLHQYRGHQVAMVFQEPMTSLNPVKTCGKQVQEALIWHKKLPVKEARQKVIERFGEVKLPDPEAIFDRYPHQISGGQKQRVMIAMAMSCQPQLLICDEPTTALDVMVQKDILKLIKDLQQKTGMSVLFISHDIKLVEEIADRIAVFYQGQLIESGATDIIMNHPVEPYTKALLACRPGLYQPGQRLPVVSDFLKSDNTVDEVNFPAESSVSESKASEEIPTIASKAVVPNTVSDSVGDNCLLSLKDIHVWYPAAYNFWGKTIRYNKALKGIDLDIMEGETLGLVGGSGCGKTTLGRAIMGLTPLHSGQMTYKGAALNYQGKSKTGILAREIQMIFQDPYGALNPQIPIGQAIAEALIIHQIYPKSMVRKVVLSWLDRVGLPPELYNRYPHEFSGGQRQRIVIARALALQPSFVICDESVSALDVSVQSQVLNLLNDLKADLGFTTLFISHDLSVVKYLCDRIAVMNEGRLEEVGTANQVYYHPESRFTKALLKAVPGAGIKDNTEV